MQLVRKTYFQVECRTTMRHQVDYKRANPRREWTPPKYTRSYRNRLCRTIQDRVVDKAVAYSKRTGWLKLNDN